MATLRQINANRQNAQKSTGPKTAEGKNQSRGNAFKHGLAGDGVVVDVETEEAVARRHGEWRGLFRLDDAHDEWLFHELVVNTVQLDRARREECAHTGYFMRRAGAFWETDRALDAEELGATIARNPALVVRRLKGTVQGCDWLIRRWGQLLDVLEEGGAWDDGHRGLMLDLSGIPNDVRPRDETSGAEPGCPEASDFVRERIAELQALKAGDLLACDEAEQASAEAGFPVKAPAPLTLVRRYIAGFTKAYKAAMNQLMESGRLIRQKAESPRTDPRPAPVPAPAPRVTAPQVRRAVETETRADEPPTPDAPAVRLSDAAALAPRFENRRARRARLKLANRR